MLNRWFRLLYWRFYLRGALRSAVSDIFREVMWEYLHKVEAEAKRRYLAQEWDEFEPWFLEEIVRLARLCGR